jgi:16S rRNA (cytosine1402-N4)-methyltransferase
MTLLPPPFSLLHIPVMLNEFLGGLNPQVGQWYIDGTFGAGGHTQALLERKSNVLAIDQDKNVLETAKQFSQTYQGQFKFVQGNFRQLDQHAKEAGLRQVSGVLLDLGVSSMQIDNPERGFAFRQDGPLDMRMAQDSESASDVVNSMEQENLAAIIYKYGEERYSRRIARAIVEERKKQKITTTTQLVNIIQRAYPNKSRQDHPARRTFQALRIYVNDELGSLEDGLNAASNILESRGRLVVLSYHSLEDRIVKHTMKGPSFTMLSKKPITASQDEISSNPRARSAKLRIAEKVTL